MVSFLHFNYIAADRAVLPAVQAFLFSHNLIDTARFYRIDVLSVRDMDGFMASARPALYSGRLP